MYFRHLLLPSMLICGKIGHSNWGVMGAILGAIIGLYAAALLIAIVYWTIGRVLGR